MARHWNFLHTVGHQWRWARAGARHDLLWFSTECCGFSVGVDCPGQSGVDQAGGVAFTEVQEGAAGGLGGDNGVGVSNIFALLRVLCRQGSG